MQRRDLLKELAALTGALALPAAMLPTRAFAQTTSGRFTVSGDQFLLDGKPFQILAGEMHYPRIPRASWRDRLQKLKALGLNSLSVYVFWNAHEVKPGQYDFSGNLDVAAFIKLAQEEGLWVNLRPGPYVCAEWDGGGLPSWLFPTDDIGARSTDPRYFEPQKAWLKRLGQELVPLLIDKGGPIILTQVENEYGSFGADAAYMLAQQQAVIDAGFSGLLYTADPSQDFSKGAIPGVVGGINFGTKYVAKDEFARRAKTRAEGPYFCSELWGGWFDAFGPVHETMPTQPLLDSLQWMLENKYSISFYMLHGGTNFGFTAGANWDKKGYQPMVASYDYDALLDEAGRPTAKYRAVEKLFRQHLPAERFKPTPEAEAAITVPRFRLDESAPLSQLYGKAVTAKTPRTLESLGQAHGLVLYRHAAPRGLKGTLAFKEVRDYALIGSANDLQATLDRRFSEVSARINIPAGQTLNVLVEAMGHCHYGKNLGKDQKGIIGDVTLDGRKLEVWMHYGLPLDDLSALRFSQGLSNGPAFHRGWFEIEKVGFTFLDVRGWGKGYLWVNGHNLGRYWSTGPQHALFVPAAWLKPGRNEVVVLDLHEGGSRVLSGSPKQIWDLASSA